MLRSYQVGGLFDGRLNIALYDLLLRLNPDSSHLDPWIGEQVALTPLKTCSVLPKKVSKLWEDKVEPFKKVAANGHLEYVRILRSTFVEKGAANEVINAVEFEYMVPRNVSMYTCSILPVAKQKSAFFIGLERKPCPISQRLSGMPFLFTLPAWRLSTDIFTVDDVITFLRNKFLDDHGLQSHRLVQLGASYCPSPGITPERVTPFLGFVEDMYSSSAPLHWVDLEDWIQHRRNFCDAHLQLAVLRAYHLLKTSTR
jgi:hypothetical protein